MRPSIALCALVLLGGCVQEAPRATASSAGTGGPSAYEALERMDTRRPVPLLPMMANHQKQMMRDHLLVVQEVTAALATEDYPAIERSVQRMGFSDSMGQTCTHMGAGAPGFTEQAFAFHHQAGRVGAAAHDRDRGRVTTELATTLQLCTACHATWRQQVVDEPTWRRLTSMAPPTHGASH